MKFSIITICFNSEAVIRKTIDAVLAQDYSGEVEYLIIDGASKDRTVEIAEEYKPKFTAKGYSYIISSEPDKGIYDAMNRGAARATGDILAWLNADDHYLPGTLEKVAVYFAAHPET